jgi:hypothetical protein
MGRKPLLLCDVDGVLSLWGGLDVRPSGDTIWLQVEGIPHALSRRALSHLGALAARFDVVWATGWEEKAEQVLRPLVPGAAGGAPWPHLELDAARGAGISVHGHWKLGSIEEVAGREHPMAFVDDVLDDACRAGAAARPGPTLLVPTDPAHGLDDEAAATLHAFADGVRDRTSVV